jgi:hypothetical protein
LIGKPTLARLLIRPQSPESLNVHHNEKGIAIMEKGKRKEVESSSTPPDSPQPDYMRSSFENANKKRRILAQDESSSSSSDQARSSQTENPATHLIKEQEMLKALEIYKLPPEERQSLENSLREYSEIENKIQGYRQKHSALSQREQKTLLTIENLSQHLSYEITRWMRSYNPNNPVAFKEWWKEDHQDKEKYFKALKKYLEIPDKLQYKNGDMPKQILQMQKYNLESLADSFPDNISHLNTTGGRIQEQRRSEYDSRVKLSEALEHFHSLLANNSGLSLELQNTWKKVLQASKDNLDKLADLNKIADHVTPSDLSLNLYKWMDERVKFCKIPEAFLSRLTNNSGYLQNFWNAWWLPLQKETERLDKLDASCIEKFRRKAPQLFQGQLQALESHHLPLERRQSPVDSLQEHGNIEEIIKYAQEEHNKLISNLDNTLSKLLETNISTEQCEKLQGTVNKIKEAHKNILDNLSKTREDRLQFSNIHKNLSKKLIELTPFFLSLAQRENTKPEDHRNRLGLVSIIRNLSDTLIKSQEKFDSIQLASSWVETMVEIHHSCCEKSNEMLEKQKNILDYMQKHPDLSQRKQETLVAIEKISWDLLRQIQDHNEEAQSKIEHFLKQVYSGRNEVKHGWHGRWMEIFTKDCEKYLTVLVGSLEISDKLQQAEGEKPQQAGRMLEENSESLAKALVKTKWKNYWSHCEYYWFAKDDRYNATKEKWRPSLNENRMELIKALQELHSDLTNSHLSQEETAKLEQSLKMLEKWHNELKDMTISFSQGDLEAVEKLREGYNYWRTTGILPSSLTARLSSVGSRLSSVLQTAWDWLNSGETSTSSNTERSEALRRVRRSQPSRWRDF